MASTYCLERLAESRRDPPAGWHDTKGISFYTYTTLRGAYLFCISSELDRPGIHVLEAKPRNSSGGGWEPLGAYTTDEKAQRAARAYEAERHDPTDPHNVI